MDGRAALLIVLAGCAHEAPPAVEPPAPVPVAPSEPPAPVRRRCQFPVAAPVPFAEAPPPRSICANHQAEERSLSAELARRFERTQDRSIVDVGFDCDALGPDIGSVVVETGGGHGGSLALYRLTRAGDTFGVLAVALEDGRTPYDEYTYEVADDYAVHVATGALPAAELDALLPRLRTALTARIREIEPPPRPGVLGFSGRMSFSSADFHVRIRLEDAEGRVLQSGFTGYHGSLAQGQYLALVLVMESLGPLLSRVPLEPREPEPAHRALFVERFLAAAPALRSGELSWWVRERLVKLAGPLGEPAVIPVLLDVLRMDPVDGMRDEPPSPQLGIRSSSSIDRTRVAALGALARITGWDARRDDHGQPRRVDDAARDYLTECGTVSGGRE